MAIKEKLKTLEAIFPGNVWYKELSQSQKKVIKDFREHIIFEIIYGIPSKTRKKIAESIQVKEEYYHPYMKEQKEWISFFEDCFCKDYGIKKSKLKNEDCLPEIKKLQEEESKQFMQSDIPNIFRLYNLARNPFEMGALYFCPERLIFQMQLDFHREKYELDETEI